MVQYNFPAITNSQNTIKGSGSDIIYAKNETGEEVVAGKKVFINPGQTDTTHNHHNSLTGSSANTTFPFFYDNNTVIVWDSNFSGVYAPIFHFNNVTKVWDYIGEFSYKTETGNIPFLPTVIANKLCISGTLQNKLPTQLFKSYKNSISFPGWYVGEYNGKSYVTKPSGTSIQIYEYNWETNTLGTLVKSVYFPAEVANLFISPVLIGKWIVGHNSSPSPNNGIKVLNIEESDNTTSLYQHTLYCIQPIHHEGNLLFCDNNIRGRCLHVGDSTNSTTAYKPYSTYISQLVFLKLDTETGSISEHFYPELNEYTVSGYIWNYDTRNKVLMFSNATTIKFFKYDPVADTFTEFFIETPEITLSTVTCCLLPALSPDMSKLIITTLSDNNTVSVDFYTIEDIGSKYVAYNYSTLNTNSLTFTGYETGNVNSDNEIEIKTVLPDEVNVTFSEDVSSLEVEGITPNASV